MSFPTCLVPPHPVFPTLLYIQVNLLYITGFPETLLIEFFGIHVRILVNLRLADKLLVQMIKNPTQ